MKDCPLPEVIGYSLLNCIRYRPVNDIIPLISYATARSGRRMPEVTFAIEESALLKKPGMISVRWLRKVTPHMNVTLSGLWLKLVRHACWRQSERQGGRWQPLEDHVS